MRKKYTLLIMLALILGMGSSWAQTEFDLSDANYVSTDKYSYSNTSDGITLDIASGGTSKLGQSNNRGIRLYDDGTTFTITTPSNQVVTKVEFTSGKNGNSVDQLSGFTVTGNDAWNPFTVGKADSYTWQNDDNETSPITFKETLSSSTGNVYISKVTVTTKEVASEEPSTTIATFVTLRNSPSFDTNLGYETSYWNVAIRQQSVSGAILPINSQPSANGGDMEYTFTPGGILSFNRATTNGNSGYTLVMNNLSAGTAQVTIKYLGGTINGVEYAPSEATFTMNVAAKPYEWTYSVLNTISYDNGYDPDPAEGKFNLSGLGAISGGEVITAVPGITMTVGAEGDTGWSVSNETITNYNVTDGYPYFTNPVGGARYTYNTGCFYAFTPIVNGYLTIYGKSMANNTFIVTDKDANQSINIGSYNGEYTLLVKPGHTYYLSAKDSPVHLYGFSFRPAYLAPTDYTAEQTTTFSANSATTAYPQLLTTADNNVMFWGTRSLVTLNNNGEVELVGSGSGMVGANIYRPGNSEIHLTAKYDINTEVLNLSSVTPENNSVVTSIEDNKVVFTFDQNISLDNAVVTLKVDADEAITLPTNYLEINGKKLYVYIAPEHHIQGATLTITIEKGSVKSSSNDNLKNPKIIHTFSFDSNDPKVSMIYPENTNSASVGTAIAIEMDQDADAGAVVIGTLTADGEEPMQIQAYANNKAYVFKPTTTLKPNTTYTLTIPGGSMKVKGADVHVTRDKSFTFTTGAVSGTSPVIDEENTWPTQGEIVASSNYSNGTIVMAFDQNIKLEPYTRIKATPVNGSEATATGEYYLGQTNPTLTVNSSNAKKLQFNYSADNLKWDVLYNLVIPANSVTAPGGMSNSEEIVIQFRMSKNPAARTLTQDDLPYMDGKNPFTWDFNNFGQHTTSYTGLEEAVNSNAMQTAVTNHNVKQMYTVMTPSYSNLFNGWYALLHHRDAPNKFEQGSEIYYISDNTTKEKNYFDEYKGIRFNVKTVSSTVTNRLRIKRDNTRGNGRLYMIGNTHYITIPSVPTYTQYNSNQEGAEVTKEPTRIYILGQSNRKLNDTPDPDASGGRFTINSGNAKFIQNFDERYGDQFAEIDKKEKKVYIVEMDPEGCAKWGNDLTFCISDFYVDKIAISTDSKTLIPYKNGKAYATDCQPYNVAYSLTKDFGQGDITGMYICSSENSGVNSGSSSVSSRNIKYAAGKVREDGVLEGTIVTATSEGPFPYFTTDVNTVPDEEETMDADNANVMKTNMLVGVLNATKLSRDIEGTNEMAYVFTGLRYITDDKGNFQYELAADDPDWDGDVDSEGYKLDEQGNKIPKTKQSNSPTFQPVLANGQDSDGNVIDTGGLDPDIMWTLKGNSSYLKLTKADAVNNYIYLDGIGEDDLDNIGNIAVNNGIKMQENTYYTLQGVMVKGTPKLQGIYIYNNKKVLIK